MANIKPQSLKLLTNRDLIALNQDPLHLQAYIATKQGECFIMVKDIKQLYGKERAFAVYNPSDKNQTVTLDFSTIDLGGKVELYDCFAQTSAGAAVGSFKVIVPAHGTKIYRAKAEKRLERKVYEAETAYLSKFQELHLYYDVSTATYLPKEEASGGYIACYLGYRPGNDIQWKNVRVDKAGHRTMTLHFFAGERREIRVEVNGKQVGAHFVKGPDWKTPQTLKVDLDLQQGDNVIRLWNDGVWLPDMDKMELD